MDKNPDPPDPLQAYMTHIFRYAHFRPQTHTSPSQLINQLATAFTTSLLTHQIIHFLTPQPKRSALLDFQKTLNLNLQATRRPTEHTLVIFTTKLLLDYLNQYKTKSLNSYQQGAIAGLLGYIIGRPLDQIDKARQQILLNQKKSISRLDGLKVVARHDGLKGFYRHENLLGLVCPVLYRCIYFGLWSRLLDLQGRKNQAVDFVIIPLMASAGASLATAIPDKLRSYCLQVNEAKSKALQRRNKYIIQEFPSTSKLLLQHLTSSEFTFTKSDCYHIGFAIIKNWLVLSGFAYGQHLLKLYEIRQNQPQSAH